MNKYDGFSRSARCPLRRCRCRIGQSVHCCRLLASHGMAWAQQPTATPAAAPVSTAAVINAKAVERLNAMGAHLRSLKAFTVNADVTVEEVLDSGQKVENALLGRDRRAQARQTPRLHDIRRA